MRRFWSVLNDRPTVVAIVLATVLGGASSQAVAQADISDIITDSITRNVTEDIGRNIEAKLFKPTLTVKRSAGAVNGQYLSGDGRYLCLVLKDGTIRFWDLELGVQRAALSAEGHPRFAVPSSDGRTVAVASADGQVTLRDVGTRKALGKLSGQKSLARSAAFSLDGKLLATGGGDGVIGVWNVSKPSLKTSLSGGSGEVTAVALSPDGELVAGGGEDGSLGLWRLDSGKAAAGLDRMSGRVVYLQFSYDGKLLYAGTSNGQLVSFAVATGTPGARAKAPEGGAAMAVSRGGLAAFGNGEGRTVLIDLASGREVRTIDAHKGGVRFVAFAGAADRLISSGEDGALRLWNPETGEKLVEVVITATGWAVIDRQGRFDGSEQGMNDVGWHAGGRDILLESLAEQFFEPGLLARYFEKAEVAATKVPANVTEGIALPPKVEIDLPDKSRAAGKPFIVIVVATDQGGGIDAVRLYHNGKLVQPGSLTQQREVEAKGQRLRAAAFQVKPVPGPNTFRAVATGLWGVEGQSERVTQTFTGEGPLPRLHVLSIGINKYSDPKLTLGYSVPDAKSIAERLQSAGKGIFSSVDVTSLYDDQATRAKILGALKSLNGVDENDVVVVYMAGHGLVVGDDWIFLPHEARFQKQLAAYRKGAITAREIQDTLIEAQAQRVLVLIDSCQSGATVEAFAEMQNFQRRYIRSFSRVAGVTVIAASRRDQSAIELPSLGHGLFTYVVLQGLEGGADTAPRDGSVTAHEIVQYADLQIPGMSKRYLDEPQTPMAFALGADFRLQGK